MNVDRMIDRINDWKLLIEVMGLPDRKVTQMGECDAIIEALRAGQQLREDINNTPQLLGRVHPANMSGVVKWDAATREEDV